MPGYIFSLYDKSMSISSQHAKIIRRKHLFRSFEAKARAQRTLSEKIADFVTESFGSIFFLVVNFYIFAIWIILNSNVIPGIKPFDPSPFALLTAIVALEAITISIFVLVSQNRQTAVQTLRDELHLQIGLLSEEEITKSLEILAEIREKVGIKKQDVELQEMLEQIDMSYIEQTLQEQIEGSDVDILGRIQKEEKNPY